MTSNWCGSGRTARLWGNAKTAFTGALLATALLSACGGGGGGGSSAPVAATAPAVPTGLSIGYDVKAFKLSWGAVTPPADGGTVTYRITEDPDGPGPQAATQIATDLTTTSYTQQVTGLLTTRLNATYAVQACNSLGCSALATPVAVDVKQAVGYFKASNTGSYNWFGYSVAMSADGTTLAVGAVHEPGNATGINGDQTNSTGYLVGAVYVFTRSAGVWSQQAYVKASNRAVEFGNSVALSADGSTLAVGSRAENSNATGINGDLTSVATPGSGAVYVFTRSAGVWSQQAYVKASNTGENDFFGYSVALSADGATLAVGAIYESSNTTGINGNQANNSAPSAGAVYVYTRSAGVWSQQAYVKASNTGNGQYFGTSVALSADGNTLAVGAYGESSNATGINGDQTFASAYGAGAVYVYTRSAGVWSQQAYIKASNNHLYDTRYSPYFGASVALSADGTTLAVGATGEASNATVINGDQTNTSTPNAGAVYIFTRSAGIWSQQAYVKASHTGPFAPQFGSSVALSADGAVLAVGAIGDSSNGDQANYGIVGSGAVYVFTRSAGVWGQQAYVKANRAVESHWFGSKVVLSGDGTLLAVGAYYESSSATGIMGNQADTSSNSAGAVYLY